MLENAYIWAPKTLKLNPHPPVTLLAQLCFGNFRSHKFAPHPLRKIKNQSLAKYKTSTSNICHLSAIVKFHLLENKFNSQFKFGLKSTIFNQKCQNIYYMYLKNKWKLAVESKTLMNGFSQLFDVAVLILLSPLVEHWLIFWTFTLTM